MNQDKSFNLNRARVSKLLNLSLYGFLLTAGLAGVFSPGREGPLPATLLLDIWFILFLMISISRGVIQAGGALVFIAVYTMTRIIPALVTSAPLQDFFQAYRWLFYLFVFAVAIGKNWADIKGLIFLTWSLIGLALINAVVSVSTGASDRPGLMLENNFELALFCGLAIVIYPHLKKHKVALIVALGSLVVLAQSRSGAVAFGIFFVFVVIQSKQTNIFLRYILMLLIPLMLYVVVEIFEGRARDRIDRIDFLQVFLRETSDWALKEWLVGTTPITALSPGGCYSLQYYSALFSSEGDGSCYSVIFHSFVLRVLFDAGIAGFIIVFGMSWLLMYKARVPALAMFALLAISASNSASVSGPNNPYVALPILLAILTAAQLREKINKNEVESP